MAGLDHYSVALLLHIVGALGLFVALTFEWLAVTNLRRDTSSSDALSTWLATLALARRIGPVSMLLLVIPGLLMAFTRWSFLGWPVVGLVGMTAMVVVGILLSRRPTLGLLSVELRIALAVGIVAVMVFEPDLLSSLLVLAASTALVCGALLIAHPERSGVGRKLQHDSMFSVHELESISGEPVRIPDDSRIVHLQFRRFAGCPVCNLHLRSIVRRHAEIVDAGIREVVVFHSSREELLEHAAALPFAVIADPRRERYAEFGVESSPRALLDPRVWLPIAAAVTRSAIGILRGHGRPPALKPVGGRLGLPADVLIASDGRVLAVKYGAYAYDQWSVDELLALAQARTEVAQMATTPPRTRNAVTG